MASSANSSAQASGATSFDVVVVGGGGAGLMAAYAAAGAGCRVVLVEKQPRLGGTTALSVGTVCTTSTPHQRAAGIADSPQAHFEDMGKFAGVQPERDNPALRRLLVETVPTAFRVLTELGVVFVGPIPEPPHRCPRLHAIVPHSRGYIRALERACRRRGVEIRTGAPARRLILEDGRVTGVEIAAASGPAVLRAERGVILASGDFSSAERAFKARFMSGPLLDVGGINPASVGDGQRLGEEAGGAVVNGDLAWGPEIRFVAPPRPRLPARLPPWPALARLIAMAMRRLPDRLLRPLLMSYVTTYLAPSHNLFEAGAILVNERGERFCDERQRPQDAISRQAGGNAFIVFDGAVAARFQAWPDFISTAPGVGYAYLSDYERSRRDICRKAASAGDLARAAGLPPDRLTHTLAAIEAERGERLRPPFYALGPARSWIVFTEGGLRVDEHLRVLARDGAPIPGLHAAGSAGQGGLLLEGHGHHLGWAFASGFIAGRAVAEGSAVRLHRAAATAPA